MPTSRNVNQFEPRDERRGLAGLVRQIKALTLELEDLRRDGGANPGLQAKERTLEQLRRRLAAVARPTATDDLGNAGAGRRVPVSLSLFALALGGFGIGTTEFATIGVLPDIASNLDTSIPSAGGLVSLYALGVVVGAPLFAVIGARLPRKTTATRRPPGSAPGSRSPDSQSRRRPV